MKMRGFLRTITQVSMSGNNRTSSIHGLTPLFQKSFSTNYRNDDGDMEACWAAHFGGTGFPGADPLSWDVGASSWSTGLTREHFDGESIGKPVDPWYAEARWMDEEKERIRELEAANRRAKAFVDSWDDKMKEVTPLMKQLREPGARGSYLKDLEKAEMYTRHKENPEVYIVERLAKEYRIMRQRVQAILWLKEDEE